MIRRRFRAMNTDIEILVDRGPDAAAERLLERAEHEFHRYEQTFSRFRPDSELSRLNRLGRLRPSPQMAEVVRLALDARETSGGRFDPTIHDALVTAGYGRSFDEMAGREHPSQAARAPVATGGRVRLDGITGEIVMSRGVRLDLGGIVKGYVAERVRDLVGAIGPCLVNAGGDIAVGGIPSAGTWNVGLTLGDGSTITVGLAGGGLATSGRDRRRWIADGREAHHLIDPATGEPAVTDLLRVTAIAGSAVDAEVLAKSLLIVGRAAATAEAEARGIPCVLVDDEGGTTLAGGLA